jgi:hypothetical protein
MTSSKLIVLVVTQIPLDNPTPTHEITVSSVRPPWIRPARKKNPPFSRSTGSVESPHQDTSEFDGDPIPIALAGIPFSLAAGLSSIMSTSSQQEFQTVEASSSRTLIDPSGAGGVAAGLDLFMPSEELMSLFRDSDIDIPDSFSPFALPGFPADRPGDAPHVEALAQRRSQGSDEMEGLVASP